MQATRIVAQRMTVDGIAIEASYVDVYVVVRDGEDEPGPTDWEAQARGTETRRLNPGRHVLGFRVVDGSELTGEAIVRFSDGTSHLFRGDGQLHGFTPALP